MKEKTICLVSACLTGLRTRYDGALKPSASCLARLEGLCWLPVCPEQLGGLATPRPPAQIQGGDGQAVLMGRARVIATDGSDLTESFLLGASQCLVIAQAQHVELALLKARSPSCGLGPCLGVTAALLRDSGIELLEYD